MDHTYFHGQIFCKSMGELGLLRPYRYPAVFHSSCRTSSPFAPFVRRQRYSSESKRSKKPLNRGQADFLKTWRCWPGKHGWLELGNCLDMLGKCLEFWMIASFPKWQWGMPHTDTPELNWRRYFWNGLSPPTGIVISLSRNKTFVTTGRRGKVSSLSKTTSSGAVTQKERS